MKQRKPPRQRVHLDDVLETSVANINEQALVTDEMRLLDDNLNGSDLASAYVGADQKSSNPLSELVDRYLDPMGYMYLNSDLKQVKTELPAFDLRHHFFSYGHSEGRSPSIHFDIRYVMRRLAKLEDIDLQPSEVFRYFAALPPDRRFVPNRLFSPWAFRRLYRDRYPEIETLSDYELFEFYMDHQGYAALSINGAFSEEAYRARYPDVATDIGNGSLLSGLRHFIVHGQSEFRVNLPGSRSLEPAQDASWIEAGQADILPLVWWFDDVFYLSVYPDVHQLIRRSVVKSGLEHFMVVGYGQGRLPSPQVFGQMPMDRDPDPWIHFDALSQSHDTETTSIELSRACEILQYLDESGLAAPKRIITDSLWPFVVPPKLGGTFDAHRYSAVHADVANAVGLGPSGVRDHWQRFGLAEQRVAPGTNLFSARTLTYNDMIDWKSGVNFFGPLSANTGLGNAARGYVAALRSAGIPINTYDISWLIDRKQPADLFCAGKLIYSINFICLNPDLVASFTLKYGTDIFDHRANVGAWVWEIPAPRPEWRSILSAFDLILTPSQFCADSFSLFTNVPVRTVPYMVDAEVLKAAVDKAGENYWNTRITIEKDAGRKIVLFIMDASSYTERKGVDVFVKLAARIEAVRPGAFCFVLKSHSKDNSLSAEISYSNAVMIVDGMFNFPDLCRLKSLADLYVSPHRAEGFGLNIMESILLDVPALYSDYGGATDLLAKAEPTPVPVELREIGRSMGPYIAGAVWCEPDITSMQAQLLNFFDGSFSKRRFRTMRQELRSALSAATIGGRLKAELETWCGLGAEKKADRLGAFRPLATRPHDECFNLGYVEEADRMSSDEPGIDRLGEIVTASLLPFFSVITPTLNTKPEWLYELYNDLLHQTNPSWEWCICDDGSTKPDTLAMLCRLRQDDARIKVHFSGKNRGIAAATNTAVSFAVGKYIVMIDHDDRVTNDLLAVYHKAAGGQTSGGILYCDEDKIDLSGRLCDTYYKPDWSPQHLTSCMYVLHCLGIPKSVFLDLGGYRTAYDGAQDHDFLLRAAVSGIRVQHVDRLMYHWRMTPGSAASGSADKRYAIEIGRRAVAAHLAQRGIEGKVDHGLTPGTYRIRPNLSPRRAALLIMTGFTPWRGPRPADSGNPSDGRPWPNVSGTYVENFVRSIIAYAPDLDFEIRLIVDRHAKATATSLRRIDSRITIVPFDSEVESFNFSEKANFAVANCTADHMIILNDDMEAMDSEWLTGLLELLELPEVGVVGGKLLYADGKVQHCGIALGVLGQAAHLFYGIDDDRIAYNAFNAVIRNYSAVTGAMMAFRRATFERAGGFDVSFPIDYNDVDFCLKAADAGLRTVYTPFARLRHFESRSVRRLGPDSMDSHRFSRRWAAYLERDPFYNRNLPRDSAMCGQPM